MITNGIARHPASRRHLNVLGLMLLGAFLTPSSSGVTGFSQSKQQQPKQSPSQSQSPASGQSAANSEKQQDHRWDPFNAEQDVEVGTFYMRKGDYDAAVSRFEHAITLNPKYAKPRYLLGECYEKKNEKQTAVKYYKEYLQVFPDAPDRKKVEKKIEKLSKV